VKLQCNCVLSFTDPKTDICATLLFDFLEVAGNAMSCHYGRQFQKLIHLICKEYFPKIKKVLLLDKQTSVSLDLVGWSALLGNLWPGLSFLREMIKSFSIIMLLSFGYVLEF
jgi:hypothetical protein